MFLLWYIVASRLVLDLVIDLLWYIVPSRLVSDLAIGLHMYIVASRFVSDLVIGPLMVYRCFQDILQVLWRSSAKHWDSVSRRGGQCDSVNWVHGIVLSSIFVTFAGLVDQVYMV